MIGSEQTICRVWTMPLLGEVPPSTRLPQSSTRWAPPLSAALAEATESMQTSRDIFDGIMFVCLYTAFRRDELIGSISVQDGVVKARLNAVRTILPLFVEGEETYLDLLVVGVLANYPFYR